METVLSSPKYRRLVDKAHERGFRVHFIYVILRDVQMQLDRIALRVRKGGHDVPADKVRARRSRSIIQALWFMDHSDRFWIFDNSGAELGLIGEGDDMRSSISATAPEDLHTAIVMAWGQGRAPEEIKEMLGQ